MGKLFALFFLIVAVLITYSIISFSFLAKRMVPTTGQISFMPDGRKYLYIHAARGSVYYIEVRYTYTANGKTYKGANLRIDGNNYKFKENADKVYFDLDRLGEVPVWYDPKNPQLSCLLEPRVREIYYFILLGSIVAMFLSYKYLDRLLLLLFPNQKQPS